MIHKNYPEQFPVLQQFLFLQQIRSLPQYAKEPWNLQTEENA